MNFVPIVLKLAFICRQLLCMYFSILAGRSRGDHIVDAVLARALATHAAAAAQNKLLTEYLSEDENADPDIEVEGH